ncbi:PilN domain-containing protein [Metabacillus halosaccharovorans]|uniref:PilN domain-containing protein n=1 Tax=Metabacillus halosaccharovorans TaxID=930124 RepID=UPI00403E00AF
MLAEINLLPQKQQRNYTNLLVLLIISIVLLAGAITVFMMVNQKNEQITQLEQEYQQVQQKTAVLQQQISQNDSSKAVAELEKAIEWSMEYPIDFVPLLNELTKKLPEKGYFYSLEYANNTSLNLLVQFESSREAAYYLKRIKDSKLMNEVKLVTVEAVPLEDQEDTVPRYLATYELSIDRNAVKAFEEEENEQ